MKIISFGITIIVLIYLCHLLYTHEKTENNISYDKFIERTQTHPDMFSELSKLRMFKYNYDGDDPEIHPINESDGTFQYLIDYGIELETLKISTIGMIQLLNVKLDMDEIQKNCTEGLDIDGYIHTGWTTVNDDMSYTYAMEGLIKYQLIILINRETNLIYLIEAPPFD